MNQRPLRIAVHALGGQGGGVLAGWIVELAESQGWIAQSTSVPGVAQRTGATIYYLEIAQIHPGAEPVLALMPAPGDVDIVLAAELMEAGRAIARGLVTPDRTVLIASSHRVFAIGEKSAMSDGRYSAAGVLDAACRSAKRLVLADLSAIAERTGAPISAVLFGALAGSGALPFDRQAFEETIRRSGRKVSANLTAFAQGFAAANALPGPIGPGAPGVQRPPEQVEPIARMARERLRDYQDAGYARLYDQRLEAMIAADRALGGTELAHALSAAAARHLALWMAYEDVIRVADLKTRPRRFDRIAAEAGSATGALHVTEFMHPRFEEVCETLPARVGRWLSGSHRARKLLAPLFSRGRFVRTSSLGGFLLLWSIARLRRWRRTTLRYQEEQERIEAWLASAVNAAREDYALGVEIIRLQRLVKGYGDTHARGLRNFAAVLAAADRLRGRGDAAERVARMHEAALVDEEGTALARELAALDNPVATPAGPAKQLSLQEQ